LNTIGIITNLTTINMKIIITESQYELIKKDLDEDYPISWDIEEFKRLNSFSSRIDYCNRNLQRISSGSSRVVYKVDDTKVLKLAKNKKGLAQNEVEIEYGNYYDLQDIVAKVFESDNDNLWVEMELARKVTPKVFMEVVGVDFNEYCKTLRYYHGEVMGNNRSRMFSQSKPDNYDEMWENEFIYDILNFVGNYDAPVGDLCRLSTYGMVNRNGQNHVVMIDYGLTSDVYDSYYK
jgi:hypothetical protein